MITGIGHVAFRVTSLQRALDFYCQKLGFREAFRLEREGQPSPWIVYIQVAPNQFIELFPGASLQQTSQQQVGSYNHFCLLVDNLENTLREFAERGPSITGTPQ